jgi:hypothetical protein
LHLASISMNLWDHQFLYKSFISKPSYDIYKILIKTVWRSGQDRSACPYAYISRFEYRSSYIVLLMEESSIYACSLPIILCDQIVWLVENKHTCLTLSSRKLYIRRVEKFPVALQCLYLISVVYAYILDSAINKSNSPEH